LGTGISKRKLGGVKMIGLSIKIDTESREECIKCLDFILSNLKTGESKHLNGGWNDYTEGKKCSYFDAEFIDGSVFG
jgi:hypothetical protein